MFVFSAHQEAEKHGMTKEKPPDNTFTAKRARAQEDAEESLLRKSVGVSFKSKLLGTSNPSNWSGFGTGNERLKIEEGDITFVEGTDGPSMKLSPELKIQLCKPWSNALILKIMGRPHSLNFMLLKLRQKWPLMGQWQLTDLEDGYFVARFQMHEDLEFVLTGGPWVIANQYLVVQKWRPNFVPGEDEIRHMPVWVRLSRLPMEWIDVDLLWNIGGMLGSTYKVDPITESQARGRFARICIEIDITKPLKGSLSVEERTIKVEYENLGLICFNCGRVGHSKELCKEGKVEQDKTDDMPEDGGEVNMVANESYGPWMQVSYGRNGRNNVGNRNFDRRNGSAGNSGGGKSGPKVNNRKPVETVRAVVGQKETGSRVLDNNGKNGGRFDNSVNHGSKKIGGSRFEILREEMEETRGVEKEQPRTFKQKKAGSIKVLSEISNKERTNRVQCSSQSNKYLEVNKSGFYKPFKENVSKGGLSNNVNKGKQQDMIDEVIEDSEVLQALHQDMMNSARTDGASGDGSMNNNVDNSVGVCVEQVDIPGASNFDEVASKLREAMKVAME
ncbi:hypothetical protein LWI29_010382 [Acer saccharum]|uniref:CCHC-type domain-containing protein n=1 Tax=Acer saccharum TaxID=4024 RepID=A0AA39VVD5_ACESA|nr:hypothetical protein LWI29_010382 [Acer saccharum]